MTYECERLVYAILLGDGYLSKSYNIRISHKESQLEYLEWKRRLLIKSGIYCSEIQHFINNGFPAVQFVTQCNTLEFGPIRNKIYTPQKRFTREILNTFTPLELCIWYFDDGGLSQKKKNGKVSANDLMINTGAHNKELNQIYIDYFKEVWGITFTQVKNNSCYRLRCGTKEARKFINIIYPYACQVSSMSYKINIKK